MQKNKFRIIIACISILSLMLILCGTSLSLFEFTKQGTTENVVKAGTLSVYFTESTGTGMGINISDAYPVSDSIGKNYLNSDQIFDFTITGENTSNNEIPFEITLEKLENSDLDNNAVKVYLTDITEENQEIEIDEPMLYSDLYDSVFKINNDEKVIYQDKVESNETYNKKFRLRMWLSDSIDFEHGNYDNKTFETIINIHSDDKNGITKIYRCDYEIGHTWDFDYTGSEQEFTVPEGCEGIYKLETWGAEGGSSNTPGGYGGYSYGNVLLIENEELFINVGGIGIKNQISQSNYDNIVTISGGYNGGGVGYGNQTSGGGATHIALESGLLKEFYSKYDKLVIVSGAGGGGSHTCGGNGGGYIANSGCNDTSNGGGGGTQTSGGLGSYSNHSAFKTGTLGAYNTYGNKGEFGKGGNSGLNGGAGGAGLYGGGGGCTEAKDTGGGGGSSYIGNPSLIDKAMYCYNCQESNDEATKTISTTCTNSTPTENCAKQGNGYARITLVSLD